MLNINWAFLSRCSRSYLHFLIFLKTPWFLKCCFTKRKTNSSCMGSWTRTRAVCPPNLCSFLGQIVWGLPCSHTRFSWLINSQNLGWGKRQVNIVSYYIWYLFTCGKHILFTISARMFARIPQKLTSFWLLNRSINLLHYVFVNKSYVWYIMTITSAHVQCRVYLTEMHTSAAC